MIITFSAILGIIQAGLWTKDIIKSLLDKSSNFDKVTRSLMKAYKTAFKKTFVVKIDDMSYWDEQTEEFIKSGNIDAIIHIISYLENPDVFAENVLTISGIPDEFKGYSKEQLIEKYEEIKIEFEKQIPETESLAVALKFLIGINEILRNNALVLKDNNQYLKNIIDILNNNNTSLFNQDVLTKIDNNILVSIKNDTIKILSEVKEIKKAMNSKLPENLTKTEKTQLFEFIIKSIKSKIDNNQLSIALEDLEQFKKKYWDYLPANIKFKVISNEAQIHLIKYETEIGADLLIESYYCHREAERALFNIAYGYYLKKNIKETVKYNDILLKKNPEDADANTIKILLTNNLEITTDHLIKTIPDSLIDIPKIAFHIAEFAKKRKEYDKSFEWYEKAIKLDHHTEAEIKSIYAKSLLEYVINNKKYYHNLQIPKELIEKLQQALLLLEEAWEKIKNSDVKLIKVDWLSDIAIINFLLGNSDQAIEILDNGLQLSEENSLLIRNKGVILLESGLIKESISYLTKAFSDNPKSDIVFKLTFAYSKLNQEDQAIGILQKYMSQEISINNRIDAERSLFDLFFRNGNIAEAKEVLDSYTNKFFQKIDFSRLYISKAEYEKSIKLLDNLIKNNIKEMDTKDLLEIANGYYESKEFKEAARFFDKIVDKSKYSPILFRYVDSLNKCEREKEALKIIENVRKSEGFIGEFFNIETSILEEIGNINKITEIYEDALKNQPHDYQLLLNLGIHYTRIEERNKIKSIIKYPFEFDKLTLEQGFQLAYIYVEHNKVEDAFDLIYEIRRKFYDEEKAHLQFTGFFFSYDEQLSKIMELINYEKVYNDCAVFVNENGINKIYILDERKESDLIRFREINGKHPIYVKLIGNRKGDEFELEESPFSTRKIKILNIMHKYTYAFNETLNNYNDFFPNATGMFKISLDLPKDKPVTKEDFSLIFKGADDLKEKTSYFENLYKSNPIPISFISEQSGFHIFDVMFGFASNEDICIRCCAGDEVERNQALNLITFEKKIVLDLTSIFTIQHLNLFNTIINKFDLVISQSTVDEIDKLLKERKISLGKKVISIGKIDEQYTKSEYSAEENNNYYDTLIKLKKWLVDNCIIKTVEKRLELDKEIINRLDRSIGKSSLDSIILSSEENYILLSDDFVLRQLAISEFQVKGIWTQILLMFLKNNTKLKEDIFQKSLVDLVCMNYHHTSIDHKTLLKAANLSKLNVNYPFTKVIKVLRSNNCDEISALRVVDKTMYTIYCEVLDKVVCTTLISGLLNSSTVNRNAKHFIHSLMVGATVNYRLHPVYMKFILGLLKDWLKSKLIET